MALQRVLATFAALLHTRFERETFTTEDSVRYTFFAALLQDASAACEDVVLEQPHPAISGAELDLWVPGFQGRGLAVEFKYDRHIPSGKNTPRTQKAGKVFHDHYRLGLIEGPPHRLFVYVTGPEMASYFSNQANGLVTFFALPVGESLGIDRDFLSARTKTFHAALGTVPHLSVTALYATSLPGSNELRVYDVTPRKPSATP